VLMPDGKTGYTRAGNFSLSAEGKIVTDSGMPVQPEITVPDGATSLTIGADGTVTAQVPGQTDLATLGQIETTRFVNPAGLEPVGDNMLVETPASARRRRVPPTSMAAVRSARVRSRRPTSMLSRNSSI